VGDDEAWEETENGEEYKYAIGAVGWMGVGGEDSAEGEETEEE
jgi:hypothetical protein